MRKPARKAAADSDDEDDDYADQKENMSPGTARRHAYATAAQSDLLKTLQARTKAASAKGGVGIGGGGAPGGSPQRFLSPQAARFLSLSAAEKTRVLKAHPQLAEKRAAREAADPGWAAREKAYDAAVRDLTLSAEQREVLTLVFRGSNVFFTGSAGTGQLSRMYCGSLLLASQPSLCSCVCFSLCPLRLYVSRQIFPHLSHSVLPARCRYFHIRDVHYRHHRVAHWRYDAVRVGGVERHGRQRVGGGARAACGAQSRVAGTMESNTHATGG